MGDDWKKENLSDTLCDVQKKIDLRLHVYASLEAQIVDISDDLAYNGHDVEDGLRAKMFTLSDVANVPLIGRLRKEIQQKDPNISDHITSAELKRSLTGVLFDDVVEESHKRLKNMEIKTPEDVRTAPKSCVAFSQEMFQELKELREFLFANMYRHYSLNRMGYKVNQIITDLFKAFMDSPNTLPDAWQARINDAGGDEDLNIRAGIVKDYIAGMTDRFAIREHAELYDLKWA
jgi:dGTPase